MKRPLSIDTSWRQFAATVRSEFSDCDFQAELIAACGGADDIAWVVFFHHRSGSLHWLEAEVPALNHRHPRDLITRGDGDLVRECLWRTPC